MLDKSSMFVDKILDLNSAERPRDVRLQSPRGAPFRSRPHSRELADEQMIFQNPTRKAPVFFITCLVLYSRRHIISCAILPYHRLRTFFAHSSPAPVTQPLQPYLAPEIRYRLISVPPCRQLSEPDPQQSQRFSSTSSRVSLPATRAANSTTPASYTQLPSSRRYPSIARPNTRSLRRNRPGKRRNTLPSLPDDNGGSGARQELERLLK
jgi:hypothetical protein